GKFSLRSYPRERGRRKKICPESSSPFRTYGSCGEVNWIPDKFTFCRQGRGGKKRIFRNDKLL
ncbi:MAG: hypothetical protein P4M15_13805, partial [Alphaproteobacteria bacterium]|nr:hypothetical protein [Alphaproteobacteria bacterium]